VWASAQRGSCNGATWVCHTTATSQIVQELARGHGNTATVRSAVVLRSKDSPAGAAAPADANNSVPILQNRPIETRNCQPAMVLRMVLNSDPPASVKPSGRIAARALTDAAIRALRDGESRTYGSLPVGAGRLMIECVKVRGVLHRRWTLRHRSDSGVGKLRLGDYPAVGLDEARTKARTHIEQVRQGIDPRIAAFEQKQAVVKAEREKAALGSLRALLASYVAWLRASGKSSAQEVELLFDRHVLKP
jgi:hypothetical protein